MGLCSFRLMCLLIIFESICAASVFAQEDLSLRATPQSILSRRHTLSSGKSMPSANFPAPKQKSWKRLSSKKSTTSKTADKVAFTPKSVSPNHELPKRVYSNESPFVEPIGEEEKPMEKFPIQTTFRVCLTDEVSNMNYQQDVIVELVPMYNTSPRLKNAKFSGSFRVLQQKKDRLYIDFHALILENGQEIPISGYALDATDQNVGLKAKVDSKVAENILKMVGETAAAVVSAASYTSTYGMAGKVIEQTAGKKVEALETESVVSVAKGTYATLKLSKPFSIAMYP